MALPFESVAAKKKEKAMPVKIVKASETKFKHAKITQPKPKKKGFLWFKKKEVEVKKRKPLKKEKPLKKKKAELPKSKKQIY